jgi:DNA-binding IclR family transcriptional regulator
LRAVLYSCIDSIEQIELLAWLKSAGRPAAVREVAEALRLPAPLTRRHAETLVARGLLQAQGGEQVTFRFAPVSADLHRLADLLTDRYGEAREPIVRAISSRAARTFADAFKLRKEP